MAACPNELAYPDDFQDVYVSADLDRVALAAHLHLSRSPCSQSRWPGEEVARYATSSGMRWTEDRHHRASR